MYLVARLILAVIACATCTSACLRCKDFFANNEPWRVVSEAECWAPKMPYYFNCLGYIQCEKMADGQFNASLQLCPQTNKAEPTGFDEDERECLPTTKCTSFWPSDTSLPVREVRYVPDCLERKRIHETDCKKFYTCGNTKPDSDFVEATLDSCETKLGKPNVRFNPVLKECEEGDYPKTWECSKKYFGWE